MASIRMVSNEEGNRLRAEEEMRQANIKSQLIGCTITDVIFSGCGITNHGITELHLEKGSQRWSVVVDAEQFYDCITSRMVVMDEDRGVELK
jgi:hypothetical protein